MTILLTPEGPYASRVISAVSGLSSRTIPAMALFVHSRISICCFFWMSAFDITITTSAQSDVLSAPAKPRPDKRSPTRILPSANSVAADIDVAPAGTLKIVALGAKDKAMACWSSVLMTAVLEVVSMETTSPMTVTRSDWPGPPVGARDRLELNAEIEMQIVVMIDATMLRLIDSPSSTAGWTLARHRVSLVVFPSYAAGFPARLRSSAGFARVVLLESYLAQAKGLTQQPGVPC